MTAMCKGNPDLWFAGRGTRFRIRCPFDLRNEGWEQAIERHGMIPDARRRRDGERPGAAMRARFGARSEPETGAAIRPADATLRGFGLPPRFSERGEAAFAAVIDRHGDLGHSALILTPRPDQAPGHARSDR